MMLTVCQANMGIRVGGGKITGGNYLINAQLVGFVNSTLQFAASVAASVGSGAVTYTYGCYILYNLGYGAYATVLGNIGWATTNRYVFNPSPRFTIYEGSGSFPISGSSKRDEIEGLSDIRLPRRGVLNSIDGDELTVVKKWDEANRLRELGAYPDFYDPQDDLVTGAAIFPNNFTLNHLNWKRQSGDPDVTMGEAPDFTEYESFKCPAGDTAQIKIPDFRYNCGLFAGQTLVGNGNQWIVTGLCQGIQNFIMRRALANSQIVLTSDGSQQNTRRTAACGTSYCATTNAQILTNIGVAAQTSCDEFPFASSEEGGNFLSTLPAAQNPTTPQLTCVPAYQNSVQGLCNSEYHIKSSCCTLFPPLLT